MQIARKSLMTKYFWKNGILRKANNLSDKGMPKTPTTNVSSKSSTIEKVKTYLDEKERDKILKQMQIWANQKTVIDKGGSSGRPINFEKAQEDASKIRGEMKGTMPKDWGKKAQKMTESASGQNKFLYGVYTPEQDYNYIKAEEDKIEKERENMKKQGVDKTPTSKQGVDKTPTSKPYISYGIKNPERPDTLTDELQKLKYTGKWQRENTPTRAPEEYDDEENLFGYGKPVIGEDGKQKSKIVNGKLVNEFTNVKLLLFNFKNKKGEEHTMAIPEDSGKLGKHVKVFSIVGDKIPNKSGQGQMEFGDSTNIQNQNYIRVRESIAILTEKAGFEPVNWNIQNLKTNQAGQIINNLLQSAEVIDSKGQKLG